MTATAPARIGCYEIVRRLGKSMTDVYLAIDTARNRQAALKLIRVADDVYTRLVIEAERRGAAIQKELQGIDSRVIEIYDYGDLDGYFYVAMQYVEGRSLADLLRSEHAVDPMRAAAIALEICEQLAKFHAGQSAVVHGDIKPANIHVGHNGTVRLLDFGIAKQLRPDRVATVHQFGSPSYCSPERLTRSQVDQQSDLWAVGATLYEMLAGSPPYQAEDTRKLESLIRSRRAPRALPAGCPRALRAIVGKALAPDTARRYASAHDFQADLQAFLEGKTTAAEVEQRHRFNPNTTLEAARAYVRKITRKAGRRTVGLSLRFGLRWQRVASATACFAAGMALWIGGALGYERWQSNRATPAHVAAPVQQVQAAVPPQPAVDALPVLYRRAAEHIIGAPDPDWSKAELYLERAAELDPADRHVQGQLALARGYSALARLKGGMYAASKSAQVRLYIHDQFDRAADLMPGEAAPINALAALSAVPIPKAHPARKRHLRRYAWR